MPSGWGCCLVTPQQLQGRRPCHGSSSRRGHPTNSAGSFRSCRAIGSVPCGCCWRRRACDAVRRSGFAGGMSTSTTGRFRSCRRSRRSYTSQCSPNRRRRRVADEFHSTVELWRRCVSIVFVSAVEQLAAGPGWSNSHELVFTDEAGAPLHPDWVSREFGRVASQAGLPHIRLHDLRHSYATVALKAGVHPKVVSERLGHATVRNHARPLLSRHEGSRRRCGRPCCVGIFGGQKGAL